MKIFTRPKKRGSILDIAFIIFIIFATALIIFVTKSFYNEVSDSLVGNEGIFEGNNESKEIINNGTNTINSYNWLFVLIFILFIIVISILAYNQEISSAAIGIVIFIVLILAVVASIMGSIFQDITEDDSFSNATSTYEAPTHLMTNFGKYILIGGIVIIVVMYISYRRQQV